MTEYYIKYECPKCGVIEYYTVIPICRKTIALVDRYCVKDGNLCKRDIGNWDENQEELKKALSEDRIIYDRISL